MSPEDPVDSVNTFIGTRDDGNTFPGASMPFGMAHSSPIGAHYSGWRYDEPLIRGFGHFFLSGAGCPEQGGLVSILPTTGPVRSFDQERYATPFTHDGEVGKPGYFRIRLTGYGGITVECTATVRAGVERFTFDGPGQRNVLVNVGQANDQEPVFASDIRVHDDRTISGSVVAQAFCGGRPYRTYFVTTFDRPFDGFGTWGPTVAASGQRVSAGGIGSRGAWVTFADTDQVTVYTAISHVDYAGADRNLDAEVRSGGTLLSFDELRDRAGAAWRAELSCVDITGGSEDDRAVFYTALYHALLQPLTGNDVDGRYLGFDDRVHRADGWTYHEFWSLWDTYRSHNQLLAVLRPNRSVDLARSVLAVHEQGGWLPRWAYANQETNTMTGDPVTPFLVDLWRFGALAGREEAAYAALWQNVTEVPPADSQFQGRAGNPNYLAKGFVQHNPFWKLLSGAKGHDADPRHGGSATLEYALADGALSIMADALGRTEDAAALRRRSRNYRLLWDSGVTDRGFTGFPRPKRRSGRWYSALFRRYGPQQSSGFHEGTAWQYQWLAQQDVPGLVALLGGKDEALRRLDEFFAYPQLVADPARAVREQWVVGPYSYYRQYTYNPNNEPDLHAPWMYTLIGQPWKTSAVVRAAQTLFVNAPNGVTGNDDLGTMSAWYLFSALGIYPAVPGTGQFLLHAPRFPEAVIHLENGRDIVLRAPGADPSKLQYVKGLTVGDERWDRAWIDHTPLAGGTTLTFDLTDDPTEATWATGPSGAPPSPCAE
ncbi:MAG TPA: GH92 family glycosyl hydrolase [Actinophytocola sp.]|uniref:GH92 family glycosyl hydrolase n=1 Tax=Actinophytocola sp. TaxID=1872138 RepID=UPI002DB65314|nr:GH92 family glycosyl hydrolase [Actinophytocola sp.]HEU5471298.1 GH92 family glycosyl hydrolase [Actinophytocola sp.]